MSNELREFRTVRTAMPLALLAALVLTACDSEESATDVAAPSPGTASVDAAGAPSAPTAEPNTLPLPPPGSPDASGPMVATGPSTPPTQTTDAGTAPPLLRTEPETVTEALILRILEERKRPLRIEHLITRGEVRQLTGLMEGRLVDAELEGRPADERYNAVRFATDDSFGFGLQVWDFDDADDATSHFERMQETFIVTGSSRVAGDTAFRAELAGIRQIVFVSRTDSAVVAVSCDSSLCRDEAILQEVAQRIHQRL